MPHDDTSAGPLLQGSDSTSSTLGRSNRSRSPSLNGSPASSPRSLSPDSITAARRSRQRRRSAVAATRTLSFASAVLSALCAGSITVFGLYGPVFQSRLRYTQLEVNSVAIAASVSLYLPVPIMGYVCDRVGPAPLSALAAVLFGCGYGLAAEVYRRAAAAVAAEDGAGRRIGAGGGSGRGVGAMTLAFVAVGIATCAMYLAAVATCAKTFGRGRHRGLALAVPIAAYGLSGMWQSQVGSRLLFERLPDGSRGTEVDVFRFFVFLAVLLAVVGVVGAFTLRIVDEQDLIDEAVGELERSGLLDGSALFTPGRTPGRTGVVGYGAIERSGVAGYGAVERSNPFEDDTLDADSHAGADLLDPNKDPEQEEQEEARLKKQWLLNAETRRFLTDHTMWFLAVGFFFMIGPGEAFINNLGTVIKTLYPPPAHQLDGGGGRPTSTATHVSIVGITSTVARILTGTLTDLLAPSPPTRHVQIVPSGGGLRAPSAAAARFLPVAVSRVAFLLAFALVLSAGLVTLATGAMQGHGGRFWIVSGLVGAGYGAVFSLTPIIITVIWGVENFATNWGIVAMFPALGATLWGLVYSAVYEQGAERHLNRGGGVAGGGGDEPPNDDDMLCYGSQCYAVTFWAMAGSVWIACLLVLWAWKGRNGWARRGIVV